ncbi:MAG: response regulator [Terracidiphilus sp.]|jgi:DNA-binding NtrC family response regulator
MTTIFLVDDDPLQASLMVSLLGRRFGEVCRASDAGEALCLIEESGFAETLGLVICGHHTLGIGGPAFVAELHTRMPDLPVLVLGTTGESAAHYSAGNVAYLAKPYKADKILTLTGQMLTDHKPAAA